LNSNTFVGFNILSAVYYDVKEYNLGLDSMASASDAKLMLTNNYGTIFKKYDSSVFFLFLNGIVLDERDSSSFLIKAMDYNFLQPFYLFRVDLSFSIRRGDCYFNWGKKFIANALSEYKTALGTDPQCIQGLLVTIFKLFFLFDSLPSP